MGIEGHPKPPKISRHLDLCLLRSFSSPSFSSPFSSPYQNSHPSKNRMDFCSRVFRSPSFYPDAAGLDVQVSASVGPQTGARTAGKSASVGPQAPETEVHGAFSAPTAAKRQARRDPRGGRVFQGGKVIFGILSFGAGFRSPNPRGFRRKK